MPVKPDKSLVQAAKYMGLVFLLPSGAIAGYVIGEILERYIHWSGLKAAGIILGIMGGIVRLVQELLRDSRRAEAEELRNKPRP
jgi:MFS family permease